MSILNRIIASVIVMLVGLVFYSPTLVLAQGADIQGGLCTGVNLQFSEDVGAASCADNGDATAKINNLIRQIINLLSAVVGIVAVIMIIVGGLRYITSGGSDSSVTGAKNTILYAVIGLVIVALAQLIVRFVLTKVTTA